MGAGDTFATHFSYDIVDGQGGRVRQTATVTITGRNDAPVLDLNGPAGGSGVARSYGENAQPVAIATDAALADVDSTTFRAR